MRRYEELDSLRGLAALVVVFFHFIIVFPHMLERIASDNWLMLIFKNSPIRILWAGPEAVTLFFVLSGFVLALQFYSDKKPLYSDYLVKRICRIYLPYLFTIIIAFLCNHYFSLRSIEGINTDWKDDIDWQIIINHLGLVVGQLNVHSTTPVIWSLIFEMRISIIFPLITFSILRFGWKITLVSSFILYVAAIYQNRIFGIGNLNHNPYYTIFVTHNEHLDTFVFLLMFVIGSIIAKYIDVLLSKFNSLNTTMKWLYALTAVLLITYSFWMPLFIKNLFLLDRKVSYIVNTVGVSMVIISALDANLFSKILKLSLINHLGKISYSLYLVHMIVLNVGLYLLVGKLNIYLILALNFLTSLIVSHYVYKWIELPSIKLGKKLVEFKNRNKRVIIENKKLSA